MTLTREKPETRELASDKTSASNFSPSKQEGTSAKYAEGNTTFTDKQEVVVSRTETAACDADKVQGSAPQAKLTEQDKVLSSDWS